MNHTHLVQFASLAWLLGVQLVQAVEPGKLKQLLREEKSGNKEGLRAEKGEVSVMNGLHVRVRQHSVLLGREVNQKGGWCLYSSSAHSQDYAAVDGSMPTIHFAVEYEIPMMSPLKVGILMFWLAREVKEV